MEVYDPDAGDTRELKLKDLPAVGNFAVGNFGGNDAA
jgi:hypothetical protein